MCLITKTKYKSLRERERLRQTDRDTERSTHKKWIIQFKNTFTKSYRICESSLNHWEAETRGDNSLAILSELKEVITDPMMLRGKHTPLKRRLEAREERQKKAPLLWLAKSADMHAARLYLKPHRLAGTSEGVTSARATTAVNEVMSWEDSCQRTNCEMGFQN